MAVGGFLLLSYPWMAPFVQHHFVFGVPLLFVFEVGGWALLILLAAVRAGEG